MSQTPFNPMSRKPILKTFQVHLKIRNKDLATRANIACQNSGLTASAFTTACIEYALAHMKQPELPA